MDADEKDEFSEFFSEVSKINDKPFGRKNKKRRIFGTSTIIRDFSTGEIEIDRLLNSDDISCFEILMVTPVASISDIKSQYKKLSLKIHPDKCKITGAAAAFNILNKAYEEIQKEETKQKYMGVIEQARILVKKELKLENRIRRNLGQPIIQETEEFWQEALTKKCEFLLKKIEEEVEYAEKTRKANEQREREEIENLQKEEKKAQIAYKKWLEKRSDRVTTWRDFRQNLQPQLRTVKIVPQKKEERKLLDEEKIKGSQAYIKKKQKEQQQDSLFND